MIKIKAFLLVLLIIINSSLFAGCWNYREIDKLAVVAGVAVDKGTVKKYCITVEVVKVVGEKDPRTTSILLTMEGDSIFDAVRNVVSISGKRLYWSHAKIVILSEAIAREGVSEVIDWYNRDAETRADVHILISKEATAKKIFEGKSATEDIVSFELDDVMKGQKNLSKAPATEIWQFSNDLTVEGISAIAPTVTLYHENAFCVPVIQGTAIFSKDKLVGFLNGEDTRDLLFLLNEVKGGILTYKKQGMTPVTLEIFKNKTRVKPAINGDSILFNITTYTDTAIDEIETSEDYIEEDGRKKLEEEMGIIQERRLKQLVNKIQSQYKSDIFGFGAKFREDNPKAWKELGGNWEEVFAGVDVNVKANIHIRNSAMLSKPMKLGD